MDFVAIDFETANQRPNSACQVAAVVVQDSQIVEERAWLIRPPSNYFAPINISVHGIRPQDVENAPSMEQVWEELGELIDGLPLLAHNARFDMGVLVASLTAYDVACPQFEFQCTRVLAKATWPGRSRYGLKPLGNWLGIDFRHHDALEDARCCAQIAILAESVQGQVGSLEELELRLCVQRGCFKNQRIFSPKQQRTRFSNGRVGVPFPETPQTSRKARIPQERKYPERHYADRWGFPLSTGQRPPGSVCPETVRESCIDRPLAGKNVVMLGPLRGQSMEETQNFLRELGAFVQPTISASTHYVVAAGSSLIDAKKAAQEGLDPQHSAAFNAQSCLGDSTSPKVEGIRVLSERQFRAMFLSGGASSA